MNTTIIKKGDEVFAKVRVTVDVEIFLGEEDDVPQDVTSEYIWDKMADTEMGDVGEQVTEQMEINI